MLIGRGETANLKFGAAGVAGRHVGIVRRLQ